VDIGAILDYSSVRSPRRNHIPNVLGNHISRNKVDLLQRVRFSARIRLELAQVSVYVSLIEYFRKRKRTRQIIIIITHNPNLVGFVKAADRSVRSTRALLVPNFPFVHWRSGLAVFSQEA